MSSAADRILIAALSPCGTFPEKQLLKNGELRECAESIIRRRRKLLMYLWIVFYLCAYGPLFVFIAMKLCVSSASSPADAYQLTLGVVIAMTQLPFLMEARLSLVKLETMVSIWELSREETLSPESGADVAEPGGLAASNV